MVIRSRPSLHSIILRLDAAIPAIAIFVGRMLSEQETEKKTQQLHGSVTFPVHPARVLSLSLYHRTIDGT
jgi:hypothetical protein